MTIRKCKLAILAVLLQVHVGPVIFLAKLVKPHRPHPLSGRKDFAARSHRKTNGGTVSDIGCQMSDVRCQVSDGGRQKQKAEGKARSKLSASKQAARIKPGEAYRSLRAHLAACAKGSMYPIKSLRCLYRPRPLMPGM